MRVRIRRVKLRASPILLTPVDTSFRTPDNIWGSGLKKKTIKNKDEYVSGSVFNFGV